MKEFNLVLDKVSKALGMTVDNVVKLYPQLRTEWSWYYVLDNINCFSAVVSILGVVAIAFVWFGLIPTDEWKYFKTQLRISIGVIVFLCIVALVSMVAKGFLCPDILIIQEFINNGK